MALSELHVCHFVTKNQIYLSLTSLIFNSQVLNLLVDKASVNKSTRLELPVLTKSLLKRLATNALLTRQLVACQLQPELTTSSPMQFGKIET